MPVKTGIQRAHAMRPYRNSWIPGRTSYRQLARNDVSNYVANFGSRTLALKISRLPNF